MRFWIALAAIAVFTQPLLGADAAAFKKFKGPKPGEWLLSAKITIPGAKQAIQQDTSACIKPGDDIQQRALGQLGDKSRGCVVSITKDTASVGALSTKCQNISASVEMIRVKDTEYRYNIDSSMAKVATTATFKSAVCAQQPKASTATQLPDCATCKKTVGLMRDHCSKLSDASSGECTRTVAKLSEQCATQCKKKK